MYAEKYLSTHSRLLRKYRVNDLRVNDAKTCKLSHASYDNP